jgi:transcriptional regulator with XRE-family HTH domain
MQVQKAFYDDDNIGIRIKKIREKKGISQRELAIKCGLSPGYLCALENGNAVNPTISVVARVALVLGVRFDELVPEYLFQLRKKPGTRK